MAQFAEDGTSHQNLTFNYTPDWFASASAFGPLPDNLPNQSLLDPSESAALQNFFDNPDHMHNMSMSPAMDLKPNLQFTGQMEGTFGSLVDDSAKGFNDTAAILHSSSLHMQDNHSADPRTAQQGHVNVMQQQHHTVDASEDEFNAASGLFNMSNRRSQGQHSLGDFGTSSSWDTVGSDHILLNDQIHNQTSSLCRQSTTSYNDHAVHGRAHSYSQFHNPSTWQMFSDQANSRHRQHLYDAQGSNYLLGTRRPHASAGYPSESDFSRSTLIRYGSDPHFSQHGYQAPRTYHEDEKGGNLMNVPLAQQAAASASASSHAGSIGILQHLHSNQSMMDRSASRNFSSTVDRSNSISSAGGLAFSSPVSATHPHAHPHHVAHTTTGTNDGDGHNNDEFEHASLRKRKKSTTQDADQVKFNRSSLLAKHRANVIEDEDDSESSDEDEDDYALASQPPAKRRKSSGAGAMLPSDDVDTPPPATAGGRKKKARNSEPRRNLSHEQKRQNHIRSEKSRRDLIKNNYGDLNSLVPALNNGKSGLSKAEALSEIVAFVEMMTDGNKMVERKIREWGTMPAAGGASSRAGASA